MGSSFIAKCQRCDLEAHGRIGGGMSNFKTFCAWPAICRHCKSITTVNMLADPLACLNCGGAEVIPYNDPKLSQEGRIETGKPSMVFDNVIFESGPPEIRWGNLQLDTSRRYLCPTCDHYVVDFDEGTTSWD